MKESIFSSPKFFLSTACVFSLLSIWINLKTYIPNYFIVLIPAAIILIIYNYLFLINTKHRLAKKENSITSSKRMVWLLYCLFFTVICFTPINEFTTYLSKKSHPFRNNQWLLLSLIGTLSSLAFLNYTLLTPLGFWTKAVAICKRCSNISSKYFLALAAVWIFCITNFFTYMIFDHIPHVQDSIAQLFQAKIFAQGALTAPLPPIPDFFHYYYDNMIMNNRWYSQYTPGHPFFLMFGVIFGVPWIINPIFAGLSVFFLYKYALYYCSEQEARFSVFLFCISPFVLFMSSSYMNHVSTLFFLLLFLYSMEKAFGSGNKLYGLIAGLALGIMFTIRTGDAFAIGLLFCIVYFLRGVLQKAYPALLLFAFAVLLMLSVLLYYNFATNGDPFLFGYMVRWGRGHSLGFATERVMVMEWPPHTPFRGILHTLSNTIALNQNLFEWPIPSLLPVLIFWMPFLFIKDFKHYLLLCGSLAAPVFYFFYFFQDLCLGPRLYYISVPFILILNSKAIFEIIKKISFLRGCRTTLVTNSFISLILFSLIYTVGIRMPQLYSFYANSFWDVDNKLMIKVQEMGIQNALIFQKSYKKWGDDLGCGFLHNTPGLDSSVIFARDLGTRNRELATFFPERTCYIASRDHEGKVIIEPLDVRKTSK